MPLALQRADHPSENRHTARSGPPWIFVCFWLVTLEAERVTALRRTACFGTPPRTPRELTIARRHASPRVLRLALRVRDPLLHRGQRRAPPRCTRGTRVELDAVGPEPRRHRREHRVGDREPPNRNGPPLRSSALAPDRLTRSARRAPRRVWPCAAACPRARPSACRGAAAESRVHLRADRAGPRPLVRVRRPQRRMLLGDVLADRERVPDHELVVVEDRHAPGRVDRRDLRLGVLLIEQDRLGLERDVRSARARGTDARTTTSTACCRRRA